MLALLTLLLTTFIATTASADTAAMLTPDDVVRAALANDPALASRIADVDAAVGVRRESLLFQHNPELDTLVSTDGDRYAGTVVQRLSISGEGFNASRSASAAVDAAEASAERARFETAANARRTYARAVLGRE